MPVSNTRKTLSLIRRAGVRAIRKMQGKRLVHFLHIGKTGGTALKHVFIEHRITPRYAMYLHPHAVKLRDVPKNESVIFFLRDPISRFVSGFYSRQRQGQPRYFTPWSAEEKHAFDYFTTPNQLALCLSSDNPEEQTRARAAMKTIRHVRESYWEWFENEPYFRSRLPDIFFVGFQESLVQDFDVLRSKLGLPDSVRLPDDDVQANRSPRHADRALDERAVENLRDWYANDYGFLGLCTELVEPACRGKGIVGAARHVATPLGQCG